MAYALGIDLGTTFTAAAIASDGAVELLSLSDHGPLVPSLAFLRDDGTVLIGEAAEHAGQADPTRLARGFKRHFGDLIPILLDRTPVNAEQLMTVLLGQIVADVSVIQGAPPRAVAITLPASWRQLKVDLLDQTIRAAALGDATLVTEPSAAALHYASTSRVERGEIIVVYDFGGGLFEATVLRRTATGFDMLGHAQAIDELGGLDIDELVLGHVRRAIGDVLDHLDTTDRSTRVALARLRQEAVAAKEWLSFVSEATVHVTLPHRRTTVRITRTELEAMIRPMVWETIETTKRAIVSAAISTGDVKAVLAVGGCSRIPMATGLLRAEFGRPVVTDLQPKHCVALGAARVAAEHAPEVLVAPVVTSVAPVSRVLSAAPAPMPAPDVVVPAALPPPSERVPPRLIETPPMQPPPIQPSLAAPSRARQTPPPPRPMVDEVPIEAEPTSVWRSRKTIAAAVAVVAVGLIAAFALAGTVGEDEGTGSTSAQNETTGLIAPTTAAAAPAATTGTSVDATGETTDTTDTTTRVTSAPADLVCGASGRCAGITQIDFDGSQFLVHYDVRNFDPVIGSGADDFHVHFFYNTVSGDQAGTPGSGPWQSWDRNDGAGQLLFNAFTIANFSEFDGEGATQICIAVADHLDAVELDTASCFDIGFALAG